jgi:hypothetical protein
MGTWEQGWEPGRMCEGSNALSTNTNEHVKGCVLHPPVEGNCRSLRVAVADPSALCSPHTMGAGVGCWRQVWHISCCGHCAAPCPPDG